MKLGLGIIARNFSEVTETIKAYYGYFDKVIIAVDEISDNCNCLLYEWSDDEKNSGMLDFSRKRNFLHDEMIKAGVEYYFTIDTDDIVNSINNVRTLAELAKEKQIDIVYLPYNYSRDEYGNLNAVHNKERILRCSYDIYWNMPIHENVLPREGYRHNILLADNIIVNHNVDFDHADRSWERNMKYLIREWNEKKENTDPRTLAYLGRCFAAKKDLEKAIFFLRMHYEKSGWDEDKCMTLCSLADIYRELKDYDTAVQYAFLALAERNDFAEPYYKLHDIYVEKLKWEKAIYWGEIGLKTKPPQTFVIQDPSYGTWRMALSLAFCYMQIGNIDKAYQLFQYGKKLAPTLKYVVDNDQYYEQAFKERNFLDKYIYLLTYLDKEDPEKIKELLKVIPESMKNNSIVHKINNKYGKPFTHPSNAIAIICGETLDQFAPPSISTGIGGSEEAIIYLSRELTKVGYEVTVYNSCGDMEGDYDGVHYKNFSRLNPKDNFNIMIGWRNNIFSMYDFKTHYRYVWLHDVVQKGSVDDHSKYDGVIVLSEFHKSLLPKCIPESKIIVSSNGIELGDLPNITREPFRMIYTSSYDRGIEHLLRRWSEVKTAVPQAELHIFYGWNNYEKLAKEGVVDNNFMIEMKELMKQDGVYEHGRVGHEELHKEFLKSRIWVYPSHFNEISCISAMKAQALGCIPVCTDKAALAETVKSGVIIHGSAEEKSVMDKFIEKLIYTLNKNSEWTPLSFDFSWMKVANQWKEEFNKRKWKPNEYKTLDDYKKIYSNMSSDNITLVDKNIMTSRYRYALDTMVQHGVESLLDVGTFDGALPVYASRIGIESTGIDINTTFIQAGIQSKNGEDCTLIGGMAFEDYSTDKKFDCVTATEIIEHVIDIDGFIKKVHGLLNDDGIFIISTPHRDGQYGLTNHDPHHIRHYNEEMLKNDLEKYFNIKHITVNDELINCCGVKKCIA